MICYEYQVNVVGSDIKFRNRDVNSHLPVCCMHRETQRETGLHVKSITSACHVMSSLNWIVVNFECEYGGLLEGVNATSDNPCCRDGPICLLTSYFIVYFLGIPKSIILL